MNKTVFIDFDGTLADRGLIPAPHLEAVHAARAAGHRIFLCTGRPKVMVPPRVREGLFDGLVCAAGGYVEIDGEVLRDVRFPAELARRTAAVLVRDRASFLLEAPDAVYSSVASARRVQALFTSPSWPADDIDGVDDLLAALRPTDDLGGQSFSKVSVFDSPVPVTAMAEEIGAEVGALPNSVTGLSGHAGELYRLGVDKSTGIAAVEAHLGLRRDDIIAIGDGHNDLEMLAYAGVGVAVEEAPPEVREVAQLIIPGPAAAGLVPGFAELGLV
ncbi:MAG: HAD hydrolase family protein [Propionicimonas sp.]